MRRKAEAGFTLLEVMAAFVIAGLATVVLLRAGFAGAAQDRAAQQMQEAISRAQSRLASVGVLTMLQPETLSGDDGGGFAWRLKIAAMQHSGKLTIYAVELTESVGARAVTLTTEKLAASP